MMKKILIFLPLIFILNTTNAQWPQRFSDIELKILTPEHLSSHPTPGLIKYSYSIKNLGPDTLCPSDSLFLRFITNDPISNEKRIEIGRILPPGDSIVYQDSVYFKREKSKTVMFAQKVSLFSSPPYPCSRLALETNNYLDNNEYFMAIILYSIVSVNSINSVNLSIYPNPNSSGLYHIDCDEEIKQMDVLDVQGNLVLTKQDISSKNKSFDLSHCSSGIYILKAKIASGWITKKVVRL